MNEVLVKCFPCITKNGTWTLKEETIPQVELPENKLVYF